ncbi:BTB and MATH domain-containing protein 38-like [Argopecten irradians]|uniref:BTB and MATH domain-containing protein 38-like n=1 Tax=Argopecten irradians TaxID=31199 RepID=UPI003722A58D
MDEPLQMNDLVFRSASPSSASTGISDFSLDIKLLADSGCQAGRSFVDENSGEKVELHAPLASSEEVLIISPVMSRNSSRPGSPHVESVVKKDGTPEKLSRTDKDGRNGKEKEMDTVNKDRGTEKDIESIATSFLQANDTSDLRLVCGGKPLYVSRIVLSIISPVLKQTFDTRSREQSVIEIPLPGKSFEDILEFLCCVYPDKLKPVSENNLMILLDLAIEYKVNSLKLRCEQYLLDELNRNRKCISPDKLVKTIQLADQYGLESVQKQCFEIATRTSSDLLENVQGFWDLSHVHTATIFLQRLKLFELASKKVSKRLTEVEAHCSLYHKNDRWGDSLCNKCLASVGKVAAVEITKL